MFSLKILKKKRERNNPKYNNLPNNKNKAEK